MAVNKITNATFETEVINASETVLLDFWAPWCGPCKMVGPILDQIAEERPDIKVCKINVDEEQELARKYSVMTIPTLMVMKNGEITNQAVGALPKPKILALL